MTEGESHSPAWLIEGLAAEGPDVSLQGKLMLFGQFVGDWDIVSCRSLQPDGTWLERRGELHMRWVLEGRGVQDVWVWFDNATGRVAFPGTTIRFYDPTIDAWHSVWIQPRRNLVEVFRAHGVESGIVLDGRHPDGHVLKWIFSEIRNESFRWHSEESWDEGGSWKLTIEMRIVRRGRSAQLSSS
jgi:hypothetical protein